METATRLTPDEALLRRDTIHMQEVEFVFNDCEYCADLIVQIIHPGRIVETPFEDLEAEDYPTFRVAYVIDSITRRDITTGFLTRDGEAFLRGIVMDLLDEYAEDAMNSGADNVAYYIEDFSGDDCDRAYDSWRDEL